MLHASAALLKIAEMEYTGGNSIFIRTILDKKYALPYRVVDACVGVSFRAVHHRRSRASRPVASELAHLHAALQGRCFHRAEGVSSGADTSEGTS